MSLPLRHPFTALLAGPTGCGKTRFIFKLLDNVGRMIDPPPSRIVYCYAAVQRYNALTRNLSKMRWRYCSIYWVTAFRNALCQLKNLHPVPSYRLVKRINSASPQPIPEVKCIIFNDIRLMPFTVETYLLISYEHSVSQSSDSISVTWHVIFCKQNVDVQSFCGVVKEFTVLVFGLMCR